MNGKANLKFVKMVEDVAEPLGFLVTGSDPTSADFAFSTVSPEGQDCEFEVEAKNLDELIDAVFEYWEDFDVSHETYLWLDDFGHGKCGAPYDMRDCYEDMDWWKNTIYKLLAALRNEKAKMAQEELAEAMTELEEVQKDDN